ncbi:MAG: hypothetical protein M0D57_16340 [Sphingobacteriales bacterium JAD_PAG50586_3]|nr:MAG: hypothetical protein M0D57_16340 [Sphingobacteriales bacterium JAD_PAG50586_3]
MKAFTPARVRNYVNHGSFDINETDGFAKAPLFSAYLLPFLALFGTHLWVARLGILLFFAFTLYCFIRKNISQRYQGFAVGIIGLQYMVFNYSHFAMAEILAACCIVWVLHFYLSYTVTGKLATIVWATLAGVAAVLIKSNHLYVVAILPSVLGITLLYHLIKKSALIKQTALAVGLSVLVNVVSALGAYLFIFLPNEALYIKIFNQEVSGKFEPTFGQLIERAGHNWDAIATAPELTVPLATLAVTAILFLIVRVKYFSDTKPLKSLHLLLFSSIWLLIELHKLTVLYLPSRYLVPAFLVIPIIIIALLEQIGFSRFKLLGTIIAVTIIGISSYHYSQAYSRRSFVINNMNNYVATMGKPDRVILGSWAATACWESKNITMPVWENYFNDHGFMEKHPLAIITEVDERDAEAIFMRRGVDLKAQRDSARVFTIGGWQVCVNWLKN